MRLQTFETAFERNNGNKCSTAAERERNEHCGLTCIVACKSRQLPTRLRFSDCYSVVLIVFQEQRDARGSLMRFQLHALVLL